MITISSQGRWMKSRFGQSFSDCSRVSPDTKSVPTVMHPVKRPESCPGSCCYPADAEMKKKPVVPIGMSRSLEALETDSALPYYDSHGLKFSSSHDSGSDYIL